LSWRRGRSAALRQLAKTILDILLRPVTVGGYNRVLVIQAWEGSAKMWWRRWVPVLVLVVGSGVLPVADGVVAPVALAQEGDDRGPETPSHPPRGESSGEPSADPARATRPDTDALLEAVAPSDRGLELAPGRHVAEVPVLGGRAKPVGVPVGVRVDGGAFPGVGAVSAVVDVPVDDGGRAAGQLSGLFRVGFEDGLARSVLPAADAVTVEVDVSGFAGGWFGEQASRLVVAWFEPPWV